ncbi:kiwellin-like [Hibiscus syriacus]|uniref:Kiwellin-like n=1 Tax=Hibiscus syriacus TaxID=106335 RepID=A0A6A3C1N7_HIBSY|nr:kiwellin-like [Hibiscus syriacus]
MSLVMDTSKFKPESHVAQQAGEKNLVQVRNLRNAKMLHEPTIVYSGIIRVPPQENASAKVSGDPPSCGNLMVGYASGLGGRENNQNPMFIGEVLSNNARESNECAAMQYFGTGSDISSVGTQASALHFDNAGAWTNRPLLEHCPQWGETSSTIQGLSLALSSNPSSKIYGAAQFTEDQRGSQHAFKEPHQFKVLKPAQELLGQYCHMTNSKLGKVHETSDGVSNSIGVSASVAVANAVDMEDGAIKGNNSGASVSGLCSSNEISTVDVSVGGSSEYQQKKAKLLYCRMRRYKLYYQQMQMVVSSFESVDCLSVATPYISLALKTVERNFRCLRNAISDRVRHLSRTLREDLLSPTTGASSSKGDINISRMKYGVQKSGGVNTGFLEPQQEGWRPQRGLPERAVAILRAWLLSIFFIHTDKHMLANRTGLARNQVSNWFINARVRVWKPMLMYNTTSDKQLACSNMAIAGITEGAYDAERRYHEKHSSMDFRISSSMDGSLISFTPHDQSRLETGGLGAVSLTLGLKHGVESAEVFQHQLQYQPHEYQLRGQFGGRMIHEFVG